MNVIIFGATGMVGQGVLRECLLDPEIEKVLLILRSPSGQQHPKLQELIHNDFFDYSSIQQNFTGFDACFFCLGVSSFGMKEDAYRHVTYDITLAAAQALISDNPNMTFIYVSGTGTDSSEHGPIMWARVKGQTENAIIKLPFKATYMFRPGYIQPMHGIKSKTKLYNIFYPVISPIYPLIKFLAPKLVTTTEQLGQAMINVAKRGTDKKYIENQDINRLSGKEV